MVYKLLLVFTTLFLNFKSNADTLIVGVLDTGYDYTNTYSDHPEYSPKLCNFGHTDTTGNGDVIDTHNHGTHVVTTIAKNLQEYNYCIVVVRSFIPNAKSGFISGLKHLLKIRPNIANLSYSGKQFIEEECVLIKKMLDIGIVVVAAAGNKSEDLAKTPSYPAFCDKRIIVAVNASYSKTHKTSNYYSLSDTDRKIFLVDGFNVEAIGRNGKFVTFTGTSQSAAILTRRLIQLYGKKLF